MATTRKSPAEKYTVVDMDAHYITDFDDLARYVDDDDPWRLQLENAQSREENSSNNSKTFPKVGGTTSVSGAFEVSEAAPNNLKTTEDVQEVMAELSLDWCHLLSNRMLTFGLMTLDDRRQEVFANAYTDYMLDTVLDADQGIVMSLPVPYNRPQAAAKLIDRVGDEDSIVGICFVTGRLEPPAGHRKYDPIYEAAQAKGLPVVYHSGNAYNDEFYMDGFASYLETHSLGFVWDNMAQLTSVICQGLPEKFPDIDFIFQESGLFWIPQMMYRLDTEYLRNEWQAPLIEKRPSEYMKERFYFCTQPIEYPPTEKYLDYVIEMLGGPERLMYASDYPHTDYDAPSSITDLSFLSSEEKAGILGENALEVLDV
jgi:predicted TIM-barrel fold metal-dependent hydrolase